jgi:hypothetical protein
MDRHPHLLRFLKWLYCPRLEPGTLPKPSVIENIPHLKRKEKSIYKPSDLWTQQDDLLFLRYRPSKRDKCYHAISRDLLARPHEILKLKIKDIAFKAIGTCQYVDVIYMVYREYRNQIFPNVIPVQFHPSIALAPY